MAPRVVQPYARSECDTAHSDGSEDEGEGERGGREREGADDLRSLGGGQRSLVEYINELTRCR